MIYAATVSNPIPITKQPRTIRPVAPSRVPPVPASSCLLNFKAKLD